MNDDKTKKNDQKKHAEERTLDELGEALRFTVRTGVRAGGTTSPK